MIWWILGIGAIVFLVISLIVFLVKCKNGEKLLIKTFKKGNVIVTGHKGHGKDLLFSFITNKREEQGEQYYSTIQYSEAWKKISVKDLNISPNTYKSFLNGKVKKIPKTLEENRDIYIADAGLYLPSTYHQELCELYPSLPLFYAIQRHLYNSNTHCNVQNLERLWDKLREQADFYIECVDNYKIPFTKRTFIQKMIYYDRYQSALDRVRPFKVDQRLLGKDKNQQALKRDFESKHGTVKYVYIINKLPEEHYDTRFFHEEVFGTKAK